MTTKRTYKEAMSIDYAISELEHNKEHSLIQNWQRHLLSC